LQIASLFVVNLQTKVSWMVGYTVPTVAFGVALSLFVLGTRLYHFVPPGGSALTRIGQARFLPLCALIIIPTLSPVWGFPYITVRLHISASSF
jgi:hypothetical protein